MKHKLTLGMLMLLIASGMLVITGSAAGGYDLSWWTVDSGGGWSGGASYILTGTIAQPDAGGPMTGGSYALTGGLWPAVALHNPPMYTISGNAGIEAAVLSYIYWTPKEASADATGAYAFTVPNGWSGTVTPSLSGYRFWPINREYGRVVGDQPAQDYTAISVLPAGVGSPFPPDGADLCPGYAVGVNLLLNDLMLLPSGDFDASKVQLWLDGSEVTADSTISQTASLPAIRASISYLPSPELAAGLHLAWVTYPTADAPANGAWMFSVDWTSCGAAPGDLPQGMMPPSR